MASSAVLVFFDCILVVDARIRVDLDTFFQRLRLLAPFTCMHQHLLLRMQMIDDHLPRGARGRAWNAPGVPLPLAIEVGHFLQARFPQVLINTALGQAFLRERLEWDFLLRILRHQHSRDLGLGFCRVCQLSKVRLRALYELLVVHRAVVVLARRLVVGCQVLPLDLTDGV